MNGGEVLPKTGSVMIVNRSPSEKSRVEKATETGWTEKCRLDRNGNRG